MALSGWTTRKYTTALTLIERESRRLEQILAKLLDQSRSENFSESLNLRLCRPSEILHGLADTLRVRASTSTKPRASATSSRRATSRVPTPRPPRAVTREVRVRIVGRGSVDADREAHLHRTDECRRLALEAVGQRHGDRPEARRVEPQARVVETEVSPLDTAVLRAAVAAYDVAVVALLGAFANSVWARLRVAGVAHDIAIGVGLIRVRNELAVVDSVGDQVSIAVSRCDHDRAAHVTERVGIGVLTLRGRPTRELARGEAACR
jgi:hypothetical protein